METSSAHLEQLGTGCMDLGLSGETWPFTGLSASPLGASTAQLGELAVVAKAARHCAGRPAGTGGRAFKTSHLWLQFRSVPLGTKLWCFVVVILNASLSGRSMPVCVLCARLHRVLLVFFEQAL